MEVCPILLLAWSNFARTKKVRKSSKISRLVTNRSQMSLDLIRQCTQKIAESTAPKIKKANSITKINTVLSPVVIASIDSQIITPGTTSSESVKQSRIATAMVSQEEDACIRYWMPLLFGLHDVIMSCDLEVRTKALTFLFDTLRAHGSYFAPSFWEILSRGVLFPIFDDMKQSSNNTSALNSKFANKEELAVWLSTTLIAALRQFVDLFTFYFDTIGFMLPNILELLKTCLVHENEALSRIGSTCIQQLLEQNAKNLSDSEWDLIGVSFVQLFEETAPEFLFFNYSEGIMHI
jgi:Sec7-like guanine-nucleotide exchange factor